MYAYVLSILLKLIGTIAFAFGLWLLVVGQTDRDYIYGAVALIGGLLLRIEGALVALRYRRDEGQ